MSNKRLHGRESLSLISEEELVKLHVDSEVKGMHDHAMGTVSEIKGGE